MAAFRQRRDSCEEKGEREAFLSPGDDHIYSGDQGS